MQNWEKVVDLVVKAYISVYGEAKWNGLSDKEKHDAVMIIVKDFSKALAA